MLNSDDIELYIGALRSKQMPFVVDKKRSQVVVYVGGEAKAKANRATSVKSGDKEFSKGQILSLFANVKKSFSRYIRDNNFNIEEVDKSYGSVFRDKKRYTDLPRETKFYYVDVNHCYWRLSYLMGILTKRYYESVLEQPNLKLYRNMALACTVAARTREYYYPNKEVIVISEDNTLYERIYENIRHSAWNIMGEIKDSTSGCLAYMTDGVMVLEDSLDQACKIMDSHNLSYTISECVKVDNISFETENELQRF